MHETWSWTLGRIKVLLARFKIQNRKKSKATIGAAFVLSLHPHGPYLVGEGFNEVSILEPNWLGTGI